MKERKAWVITAGSIAAAVMAVWALGDRMQPVLASEAPPWVGTATSQKFAQNFQQLQQQTQELANTVQSLMVAALLQQRAEAQAAINEAARNNRRDPIAEAVRDRANIELTRIIGVAPQP